jgi:hypothetical protein
MGTQRPGDARICEAVRQAKEHGEEASQRADQAKAECDARAAAQRQATEDGETHAMQ